MKPVTAGSATPRFTAARYIGCCKVAVRSVWRQTEMWKASIVRESGLLGRIGKAGNEEAS